MDDGHSGGLAERAGGETGIVMEQAAARLHCQREICERDREFQIIHIDENIRSDGEVVGTSLYFLGHQVEPRWLTGRSGQSRNDFRADIGAVVCHRSLW